MYKDTDISVYVCASVYRETDRLIISTYVSVSVCSNMCICMRLVYKHTFLTSVSCQDLEAITPSSNSTPITQILLARHQSPIKRSKISLEKWLLPAFGQGNLSLEHFLVQKSKGVLKKE